MWIDNERVWEANTPKIGLHSSRATIAHTFFFGGGRGGPVYLTPLVVKELALSRKRRNF